MSKKKIEESKLEEVVGGRSTPDLTESPLADPPMPPPPPPTPPPVGSGPGVEREEGGTGNQDLQV